MRMNPQCWSQVKSVTTLGFQQNFNFFRYEHLIWRNRVPKTSSLIFFRLFL